ncbi:MAG: response regulator [Ardenticatenales bacterium]|nr:response regulator [Ardenticatenales bacterium]
MSAPIILYVEDNIANRELVKRVLEVEGYEVIEAQDGPTGLELAAQRTPDLILMDINLPEMDGYAVTAELRKLTSLDKTPIVALTANVMRGDREKSLLAGCDGYIRKPINIDELPEQIAHFLAGGRETT